MEYICRITRQLSQLVATRPLKPPVYSIPIASQSFAFITGAYSEKLSLFLYFFNKFIFNGNLFVLLYKQYTNSTREKTDN